MTPTRVRNVTAAIVLVATSSFVAAAPVVALDEAPKLGLTPVGHDGAYFALTLEPGERRQLQVEAANFGLGEVQARTYAADVYSIINGGFGAELFGEPPSGTSLWLTYPAQEATLGPQDALTIDFEVAVPDATPPGEYVTALVIENVEPFRGSGSVSIDQVNRNAIAVAVTVPGNDAPGLQIGEVAHAIAGERSVVTFEIDNPGNVHLKPEGTFRLLETDGNEIHVSAVTMDSVYAGTATLLEAPLTELLPAGDYCAELLLTDPTTGASDEATCLPLSVGTTSAGSGPSSAPGSLPATDVVMRTAPFVGLLGALLAAFALFLLARRRRRSGDRPERIELEILRVALATEDAVRRAWLVRRDSGVTLAIEAGPGMAPDDGARLVARIRRRIADSDAHATLSVRYLQGAGVVERTTAGIAPFYSHAPGVATLHRAGA